MAEVLILGAGMVGTATALALQARGHDVVLADRRAPGRETSYGNAGVIQGEAAEPYGLPTRPLELLSLALGARNAVRVTPAGVADQFGALMRYLRNSLPARHRAISAVYSQLTGRAIAVHEPLVEAAGAGDLMRPHGFRQAYADAARLEADSRDAERLARDYGRGLRLLDGAELARAEPGLRVSYAGAIQWEDCWACSDPGGLVTAYAGLFAQRGGEVVEADAQSLSADGSGWRVAGPDGPITAERVVLALGPWTPRLLARFGYLVPMVGKRGYHLHFRGAPTLNLPLMDMTVSSVMSPMRAGLRVATGAELVPMTAPINRRQIARAEARARQMFDLGEAVEATPWVGTRPCLPGMLPLLGELPRTPGLWVHFGHGHQGFTLGPVTAELLAAAMAGETSPLIAALSPARAMR